MRTSLSDYSPKYCLAPLVAGALVAGAAAIGSSLLNYKSQKDANKVNKKYADEANEMTRQEFDYQKQLNSQIMSREDTAYQRAVQDARQAGLSPLVVAGTGGAGAGGSVSGFSGSMQSPNIQAPQIETNTFTDMMNQLVAANMQDRQLKAQSESQDKQLSFESMKLSATLDAQNDMLDKQIEAASLTQDKELADRSVARIQQQKQFNSQLNFLIDSKNSDYVQEMQKEAVKSASSMGIHRFYYVDSLSAYEAGMDKFVSAYTSAGDRVQKEYYADHGLGADQVTETTSANDSSSVGTSAGVSAGSGSGSGASGSAGLNASYGNGTSDSVVKTSNVYEKMQKKSADAGNRIGFPILVDTVKRRD